MDKKKTIEELRQSIKKNEELLLSEISSYIKGLIDKYGEKRGHRNSWFIFDYCTEYGFDFLDSTIDEVIYYDSSASSIEIVYNANENDSEYLDSFSMDAIYQFYSMLKAIEEIINKNNEE